MMCVVRALLWRGAIVGCLGSGLAACDEAPPPAQYLPITVQVVDGRDAPVAEVAVTLDGQPAGRTGGSGRVVVERLGRPGDVFQVAVALPMGFRAVGAVEQAVAFRLGESPVAGKIRPVATELTFRASDERREVLIHAAVDCSAAEEGSTCEAIEVVAGGVVIGRLDARGELWATHRTELHQPIDVELRPGAGATHAIAAPKARFTPAGAGDVLVMRRSLGAPRVIAVAGQGGPVPPGVDPFPPPKVRVPEPPPPKPPSESAGRRNQQAGEGGARRPIRKESGAVPTLSIRNVPERVTKGPSGTSEPVPTPRAPDRVAKSSSGTPESVVTPLVDPPSPPQPAQQAAVSDTRRCSRLWADTETLDDRCRALLEAIPPGADEEHVVARKTLFFDAWQRKKWRDVVRHTDALKAIGRLENDPEVHYRRGEALSRLKRYPEAIASLELADVIHMQWSSESRTGRVLGLLQQLAFAHERMALRGGGNASGERSKSLAYWRRARLLAEQAADVSTREKAQAAIARLEGR